jgi:hypothetical protein
MGSLRSRGGSPIILLVAVLLAAITWGNAHAAKPAEDPKYDKVTVRGQILLGNIVRFRKGGIEFNTVYGKGTLFISYDRIESIESERTYRIQYGKEDMAQGQLLGLEEGELLIGPHRGVATRIPVKKISAGLSKQEYEASFWNRWRAEYPHWRGSLDVGLEFEEGAVDKNKVELGLSVERRLAPTRFAFRGRYAYETEETADSPRATTKDELDAVLIGEYDLTKKFFAFANPSVEWDKPRAIDLRWYPSAGIGYRFFEDVSRQRLLQVGLGLGYVDEDFIGFRSNSYLSAAIIAEGRYSFGRKYLRGRNVTLRGRLLYMPGLDDPDEDWLFRIILELIVPIVDPLNFKIRVTESNDNNPAPDVGDNKTTTTFSLSLEF